MIKLNKKASETAEDWNNLKPREKRALIEKDPQRAYKLRDKLYKGGYTKEGREIISLTNRKNGLTGKDLIEANKLQHEERIQNVTLAKEKRYFEKVREKREKRLASDEYQIKQASKKTKRLLKKYGISIDEKRIVNIIDEEGNFKLANTDLMRMGKKKYIKLREQMNNIANIQNKGVSPDELEAKIDKEWAEAMEQVRIINVSPDYGGEIKRNAIQKNKDWLELKFFKDARTENQYQRIINEYLKHLPIDKLNDIISVLTDPRFLKEWDSDQESDESNADKKTERQWDFIKMLRNETGKDIFVDTKNPYGKLKTKKWKDDGSVWRFSNFN